MHAGDQLSRIVDVLERLLSADLGLYVRQRVDQLADTAHGLHNPPADVAEVGGQLVGAIGQPVEVPVRSVITPDASCSLLPTSPAWYVALACSGDWPVGRVIPRTTATSGT